MEGGISPADLVPETAVDQSDASLSPSQLDILITIERTGAGLSMVAIAFTILTFFAFRKMRTTPNLFLVCASTANAGASCASMIGYDGMRAGLGSSLCQAQAFIFQVFMQSDPWWSFAMAANVFAVFFYNASPCTLRKYVWAYFTVCFGGPVITALALVSVHGDPRGPIFGDAVLWCWIDNRWSLVRIYSYYIPVWTCIFLSILIYVAVGYHVFHHRNQLRNLALNGPEAEAKGASGSSSETRDSTEQNLTGRPEIYGTAITEVQVTSDVTSSSHSCPLTTPSAMYGRPDHTSQAWAIVAGVPSHEHLTYEPPKQFETVCSSDSRPRPPLRVVSRLRAVKSSASLKLKRLDPVKMAYLRTSFIFGFAILVTWIPSSINRLYSIANDNKVSFPLSVASGCVLPVQGVWNAIIYFSTSWYLFCEETKTLRARVLRRGSGSRRETMRLDSRLDALNGGRRSTFDRSRLPDPIELEPCHLDHGLSRPGRWEPLGPEKDSD